MAEQYDPCPTVGCDGTIIVVNTEITEDGAHRVRYLGCRKCGYRSDDNKRVVPIEHAPGRNSRRLAFQRLNLTRRQDDGPVGP